MSSGLIGTITTDDRTSNPYKITGSGISDKWYYENEVEKVTDSSTGRPTVGDKVKVT